MRDADKMIFLIDKVLGTQVERYGDLPILSPKQILRYYAGFVLPRNNSPPFPEIRLYLVP
jgi:hypothetical protein